MDKVYVYLVYNEDSDSYDVRGVFSSVSKLKEYCVKNGVDFDTVDEGYSGGERYYREYRLDE